MICLFYCIMITDNNKVLKIQFVTIVLTLVSTSKKSSKLAGTFATTAEM